MWTPEATDKADDKHLIHGKQKKSMGGIMAAFSSHLVCLVVFESESGCK